jgi:transposase-like protein
MAQRAVGENARKKVEKPGKKGESSESPSANARASARDLTRTDWLMIRYLVSVEQAPVKSAARRFRLDPSTVRYRARKEFWRDPARIAELPSLEELIVMRNQKEILDALGNMSGKLEIAMRSDKREDVDLAAKKAELIGKTVRSHQSVARASEVSATTMRKVKANDKQPQRAAQDRAAIKAELDRIAAKTPT